MSVSASWMAFCIHTGPWKAWEEAENCDAISCCINDVMFRPDPPPKAEDEDEEVEDEEDEEEALEDADADVKDEEKEE